MQHAENFNMRLVQIMQSLGYKAENDGVCFGFIQMWTQAVLSGDTETFINRIQMIVNEPNVSEKIKSALQQSQRIALINQSRPASDRISLPDDVQQWLDVHAFFDGIELYHAPFEHGDLLSGFYGQADVEYVSNFAASEKLLGLGGAVNFYTETMIFSESELADYLGSMESLLLKHQDCANSIVIQLHGLTHVISVGYQLDKAQWRLIDVNHPEYLDRRKTTTEIADVVMRALVSKTKNLGLTVRLIADKKTLSEHPRVLEDFEHFNKSRFINVDHVSRRGVEGATLAYQAAKSADANTLKKMLAVGLNINERVELIDRCSGESDLPLLAAVMSNHPKVVDVFANAGIDLYQKDKHLYSPAFVAANNNSMQMMTSLLRHGVDLDAVYRREGIACITAAISKGHWEMAAFILANMKSDGLIMLELSDYVYSRVAREKLAAGLISLLQKSPDLYHQLAKEVVDGKNTLGMMLNSFTAPFSSFFTNNKYQGRPVTGSVMKIIEAINKLPPVANQSSLDPWSK